MGKHIIKNHIKGGFIHEETNEKSCNTVSRRRNSNSTVGVTGSAVFAKGDTNYDVESMDFENVELRVAFRFNNGSDTG